MHPERTHWAKSLLFWGEGKRDEVFRNFLELKTRLYICNFIFVWKKDLVYRSCRSIFVNKKHIQKRKEGRKEIRKGERKNDWMTLKTKLNSSIISRRLLSPLRTGCHSYSGPWNILLVLCVSLSASFLVLTVRFGKSHLNSKSRF